MDSTDASSRCPAALYAGGLLEIITLKQLKYHNKPIVILNINGFRFYA